MQNVYVRSNRLASVIMGHSSLRLWGQNPDLCLEIEFNEFMQFVKSYSEPLSLRGEDYRALPTLTLEEQIKRFYLEVACLQFIELSYAVNARADATVIVPRFEECKETVSIVAINDAYRQCELNNILMSYVTEYNEKFQTAIPTCITQSLVMDIFKVIPISQMSHNYKLLMSAWNMVALSKADTPVKCNLILED